MKKTPFIPGFVLLAALLFPAAAGADAPVPFTADEIRAILAHGPWPVPIGTDPSNRVSGKREATELGEHLFFERRMSASGKFACASCHAPERSWTDNLVRGAAAQEVRRNTPTLMNVRLARWFGWDGAADSLWSQSIRPILDPKELGATSRHVADLVRGDEQLACRYRKTFGAPPSADDEAVLVDVAKALAAFQETLESAPAPFDRFRDALARGEPAASSRYAEPAQRGLRLFVGKAGCSECHSGPNFSSGEFRNNGFAAAAGSSDPGRSEGVKQVRASRFNLLGRYNDDASRSTAAGTRAAVASDADSGAFKVPTLRNTLVTAPYGHHGRVGTLAEVVRHYSERGAQKPLNLTAGEQSDLVVFLESLSTFSNLWRPGDLGRCL